MRHVALAAALLVAAAPAVHAQAGPSAKPPAKPAATRSALHWGPAPAVFPKGAKMAVVSGDPSKAENFVVELSMPGGYKIPPHFHPTDETVTVKKGTFLYAMGDTFEASQLQTMKVGQSGTIPATMHHYAQAKGPTVVAVSAMGPFQLTYVNPADDPQQQKKP